ncbi:Xaa-Pro dipeptidyl-peptidase [Clostridium faecium]|uniref:Xaa-Pro dipeptidyl-peptidase n=1 Tax=Clostridium faecium TaxID=2762223 RepID=A0ABR8YPK3_9CLOT|nr:Xaa-Pro dipeptidyl-peptidase [Clostridium faecium]MBD8045953.1 Xaa-Pro dipeptidyl-peptidase [Clostridium faecium]
MKKIISVMLTFTLIFSIAPVAYASDYIKPSTVISEEMAAMNNLGLIQGNKETLTPEYLKKQPTRIEVATILLRLKGLEEEAKEFQWKENFSDYKSVTSKEEKNILAYIKANPKSCLIDTDKDKFYPNKYVNEKEFYNIVLELLGYEQGNDFTDKNIIKFAKSIGLNPSGKGKFTNDRFAKALNDCLKSKTKNGREYFEVLLESGFMSDFNKNKEVPEVLVFDGKTQPIFKHDEAIYEKVYVESPQDTDLDGKRDLLEVWIKRPAETEKGMKVPAIYEVSPYRPGTNDDLYITHNVDKDLVVSPQSNVTYDDIKYKPVEKTIPAPRKVAGRAGNARVAPFEFGEWYNYFIPRGYAVVFSGGVGTRGSDGITSTGSVDETISTIAVIDWLNGRAKAFTNKTDNIEVSADWCTGNVGMSGRSYLGTLSIAAATTGVEGLKTVVPVAAISNWYDYYRSNGVTVPALGWQGDDADLLATYCMSRMFDPEDYSTVKEIFEKNIAQMQKDQDRDTGDYNAFWDERNYLNNADKIKASVFLVHGLNDWNVKTKQFDMLWKELEKYNIPRKVILHQGDHMGIENLVGIDYNDIMNRWFDYWLYDIDNNVMETTPTAIIQSNVDLKWETFDTWPVKGSNNKFYLDNDGKSGKLTSNPIKKDLKETFTDDLSLSQFDRENPDLDNWLDTIVKNPEIKRPDRLSYITEPVTEDTRISGTVKVTLKASIDKPTANISAMLVDYGSEYRPTLETEVVVPNGIIYGGNAGSEDIVNFVMDSEKTDYKVISRGWMDAQNRVANYRVDTINPGEEYTFNLNMQPMDYTVKKGHKIGLIILSTDAEFTVRPLKTTNFKVNTSESSVEIPMVSSTKK